MPPPLGPPVLGGAMVQWVAPVGASNIMIGNNRFNDGRPSTLPGQTGGRACDVQIELENPGGLAEAQVNSEIEVHSNEFENYKPRASVFVNNLDGGSVVDNTFLGAHPDFPDTESVLVGPFTTDVDVQH